MRIVQFWGQNSRTRLLNCVQKLSQFAAFTEELSILKKSCIIAQFGFYILRI